MSIKKKFSFLSYVALILGFVIFFSVANATVTNNTSAYQRLEEALSLYKVAIQHPWPRLSKNKTLSLGMHGPEVLVLRQRLCATQDLPETVCHQHAKNMLFDNAVKDGVIFFQERHGLISDGEVGELTRHALNVSPTQRVHQIQINLQRWSRLMALVEPAYIWINVPDHHLRLIKDHHSILTARIIVGKPSRQTPEINSKVTRIILNPHWTVPPGIARNDVIPAIIKNRNYLQQHRMRVFSANQPNKALDPASVDWLAAKRNPSRIILRQDPGPHNALGQIKFDFSNSHMVYLHDTPSKQLFDENKRLFSSGCVRMEDPFDLLEALAEFDPSIKQTESQITSTLESGKTVVLKLKQAIPIHLTYITVWVDSAGVLHFWDDIYSRDPKLSKTQEQKLDKDLVQAV